MFAAEPERWRTYLPFGASAPDRTLDYAFVGRQVQLGEVVVLQETGISDHLPILVTLTL
jgi:endonuclease/exonuclease/phosphatase family metal-dependent hydrolase